ncbi:MAG: hypothetical protein U0167_01350 [bacterium]
MRGAWIVAGAAVVLYARTLGHFFVSDDFLNLERSTFRTLAEGLALFSTRGVDFYRPLARLHFGVMAGFFSDRVLLWNGANVALHALVSLAAAWLARDLLGERRARTALFAGLLFAVHYLHVEPVLWASGVATLLVTLWILLALHFFRRARETGRPRERVLSVVAFAGALLSQETAVAFVPLLLLTTWVWPAGREGRAARWPSVAEAAPYVVLLVAYAFVATSIDRGGAASPYRFRLGAHVLKNVAFFALGGFVPVRYWRIQELWASAQGAGGALAFAKSMAGAPALALPLLAGAAGLALAWRRGGRDVRGSLVWIAAASTPFLLLPGSGERFQYLSSFGACLALALGAEAALRRAHVAARRRAVVGACAAGIAVLAAAAVDRQNDWLLASRWTRSLVDRWNYFQLYEPTPPVEFVGVPDRWRSAWVFRNGFSSMVRLYWEGRSYWREEERPDGAPPAYRMRVSVRPDGTLAIVPAEGGGPRPALREDAGRG